MAIHWLEMRSRVLRVLDDLERTSPNWTDDDMADYGNEALARLAKHTAREAVYTTQLTDTTSSVELPDDLLDPGAVMLTVNTIPELLKPVKLIPGNDLPSLVNAGGRTGYYWYPHETLNFIRPVVSGRQLTIHYWAYYARLSQESAIDSILPIPRWMEEALKWRMLVSSLAKPGAQKAILAQYMTKRDAGQPEQNSLTALARFYEHQYEQVMSEHPAQDRGGWERE